MGDPVPLLCKLASVPLVQGSHKVACDSLGDVDVGAAAFGALLGLPVVKVKTAVKAAVVKVVDGDVADVDIKHVVQGLFHSLEVVRGVAVHFDVEDMPRGSEAVVLGFDLCLVEDGALVVDGNVVAVGVVLPVGDAGYGSEDSSVGVCKGMAQSLSGCGQKAEVLVIALGELLALVIHVGDDLKTQLLNGVILSVVLSLQVVIVGVLCGCQGYKGLRQADKADAQGEVLDNIFNCVVPRDAFIVLGQVFHDVGELSGLGRFCQLKRFTS